MGFKTTNYFVKDYNKMLDTAYAYIIECHSDRKSGVATIGIFENRENAQNSAIKPYETHKIYFDLDRNENDRETAYKKARENKETMDINPLNGLYEKMIVKGVFADWQDDIVW